MSTLFSEGTGEELARHLDAHPKERFRLTPMPEISSPLNAEKPKREPNWAMLEALRKIEEGQKGRRSIDGSDSIALLHEARDGEMYDYDPDK